MNKLAVARRLLAFATLMLSLFFIASTASAQTAAAEASSAASTPPFSLGDADAAVRSHESIVRAARKACGYSLLRQIFSSRSDSRRACVADTVDAALADNSTRSLALYWAALSPDQRYSGGSFRRRMEIAEAALNVRSFGAASPMLQRSSAVQISQVIEAVPRQLGVCESPLRSRYYADEQHVGLRCDDRAFDQPTALDGFARMRYHIPIGN